MDLTADEVLRIRTNARDNGTTVLGALGAAMILATDDLLHPEPDDQIVVTTTLDIRDGLRVPVSVDDLGIYAAVLNSRHSNLSKMSEWDHARRLQGPGVSRHRQLRALRLDVHRGRVRRSRSRRRRAIPASPTPSPTWERWSSPATARALRPRKIRGALGSHHATFPYVSFNGIGINGSLAMTLTYTVPVGQR